METHRQQHTSHLVLPRSLLFTHPSSRIDLVDLAQDKVAKEDLFARGIVHFQVNHLHGNNLLKEDLGRGEVRLLRTVEEEEGLVEIVSFRRADHLEPRKIQRRGSNQLQRISVVK